MNCSFNIRYKPRTTRAFTKSDLTVYDSADNTALNALTVYGKSEVVDGAIVSAGEGWATVDLGNLTWTYNSTNSYFNANVNINVPEKTQWESQNGICTKYNVKAMSFVYNPQIAIDKSIAWLPHAIRIKDTDYTDETAFKNSLNGVILAYEEATPTNNTIAIKTDDGSGINGTMAVFTTGTPLRGITGGARDVMTWDGSSGEVTKNCNEAKLANLTWGYSTQYSHPFFTGTLPTASQNVRLSILSANYIEKLIFNDMVNTNKSYCIVNNSIRIRDDDYNTVEDFVASLGDVELVYELATPTTTPLTTAENDSIAALRTFTPQTHAQNNAGAEMTVDYTIKVPTI